MRDPLQLQQDGMEPEPEPVSRPTLIPQVLFENLQRLARVIVETLGNQCEVVIHDLADLEHSIVWIEGGVTKRRIGGSITDLGIQKVQKQEFDDLTNYQTRAPDGRMLKSSSTFLRNEAGEIVGAFCINWDVSALITAEQIIKNLVLTTSDESIQETFADDVSEILERMIDECLTELGKPLALMDKVEKVSLVEALEQKGAFQLKRAVPIVALRLGVTRQTIYNYLSQREGDDEID